jgi:hypothetical protein
MTGIKPNDVLFIEAKVPAFPGTPSILPIASGVTVLYVDDTMFTVMTPEGFPVAGWNTFSVFEDDGVIFAQVQSFERASDPIYEMFDRFFGAGSQQEKIWKHVLANLASHLGIDSQVELQKVCVDGKLQWSHANNIWNNAGARTVLYKLGAPVRWTKTKLSRK